MSIKLQVSKEQVESSDEAKVHFIPAAINNNGVIAIDEYFNQYTEEENGVFINALRGYPLRGAELKLPDHLQGVIFRENEQLQIDDAERVLKFHGKFEKFMFWNYDKTPSENDPYRKVMHWIKVADALHSEVESLDSDEDVKK